MAAKRTTHRSSAGKKLYAVRKTDGTFKDIQTYERAHRADLAKSAKGETSKKSVVAVAKKRAAKKPATAKKPTTAKKPAAKKPAVKKAATKKPAAKKAVVKKTAK